MLHKIIIPPLFRMVLRMMGNGLTDYSVIRSNGSQRKEKVRRAGQSKQRRLFL